MAHCPVPAQPQFNRCTQNWVCGLNSERLAVLCFTGRSEKGAPTSFAGSLIERCWGLQ